jgi:hypothetical protein
MGRNKITIKPGTPADIESMNGTREWRALTPKQRTFVTDFLTTGDAPHALAAAYPKAAENSRRSLQCQVLRAQAVTDFLEIWKFRDTESARPALLQICQQQLRAAKKGSQAAASLAIQIERLTIGIVGTNKSHFRGSDEDPNEPEPTIKTGTAAPVFTVGMRVTERDAQGVVHVGIVKALDASGRPSEIQEVKS